jgi:phage-related protein
MDEREAHIRRNIDATRESMSEKIERLEGRIHKAVEVPKSAIDTMIGNIDQVKCTIDETKSAIDNGLEAINHAVEETVIRVKSTVGHIAQLERNPWIMFGSAILLGCAIGNLNRRDLLARGYAHTQLEERHR